MNVDFFQIMKIGHRQVIKQKTQKNTKKTKKTKYINKEFKEQLCVYYVYGKQLYNIISQTKSNQRTTSEAVEKHKRSSRETQASHKISKQAKKERNRYTGK